MAAVHSFSAGAGAVRRACEYLGAIFAVLTSCSAAFAGAFTLEPGETKLFVTVMAMSGDRYFDRDGVLRSRGRYDKRELQLYGEYGIRDGLTAFGSTAFQKISIKDFETERRDGFGRTEAGLRLRLWQGGGWIVSIQGSAAVAGAKESARFTVVGESDDQLDARALVARTFEVFGKPGFMDMAVGYRARFGDPADEIRFETTVGVRPAARWELMAQSFNSIGTSRWRGPLPIRQRTQKLQGLAIYALTEHLSLVAAAFFTPAGRDALDERGGTLGIALKF